MYVRCVEHTAAVFLLKDRVFELGENGASKAAKTINTKRAGEAILDSGSLNGLKELASLLPEDSKAFELAQRVDEASGAYRIGELYAAVCEELGVKKAAQTLPVETTVDPDIEREQMLDEMTREVIRDLETRRSIEKAPPHQRKVLENIIAELDKLRPKYQHVSPFLDTTAPDARSQPATVRAPVVSAPSSVSAKAAGVDGVSAGAVVDDGLVDSKKVQRVDGEIETEYTERENPSRSVLQSMPDIHFPQDVLLTNPSTEEEWSGFPVQRHHFATNKNKKYTPMFERIISKYGLKLDGEWNTELMPHIGRHPNKYHKWIFEQLLLADRLANGDREILLAEFEKTKKRVRDNPLLLRKKGWS